MKTTKWLVAALAACAIALIGCKVVSEPEPVAVESITLNMTTFTLAPGDTRKLTATVNPNNADGKTVTWSSSDTSVAMVGSDGTVTAMAEGKANITAQAGGKTATCAVTVKPNLVAVQSVTLDATTLTLAPGATKKLTATVNPDNADDKSVKWSSSNVEVAMVSSDGTVVSIKVGTAAITAQAGDKTAICVVIVKEESAANPDSPVVNPDSPVVNPDSPITEGDIMLGAGMLTIEPGKTRMLQATVTTTNADDKTITWSSSDTTVATVDSDGMGIVTITAMAKGTATITAQAGGMKADCMVTVKPILIPVEDITNVLPMLPLPCGDMERLTVTIYPGNTDDRSVSFLSSNPDVATVDYYGCVRAVKKGTAIITVQAGDKTAECFVAVDPVPVEKVTLNEDTLELTCGEMYKLNATITPEDAYYERVRWEATGWSYNESPVVAVDFEDGTVTALREGTATVYVIVDGIKTAECKVTVKPAPIAVESVTFWSTRYTFKLGNEGSLIATVMPNNADDKTVTWSSSDPSVATVTANSDNMGYATVTALKEGTTIITASAGGKEATCEVTVVRALKPITNIFFEQKTFSLHRGFSTATFRYSVSPDNTDDTVIFSSSNPDVATVDNKGMITGVNVGTATITAQAEVGDAKATCEVSVWDNE